MLGRVRIEKPDDDRAVVGARKKLELAQKQFAAASKRRQRALDAAYAFSGATASGHLGDDTKERRVAAQRLKAELDEATAERKAARQEVIEAETQLRETQAAAETRILANAKENVYLPAISDYVRALLARLEPEIIAAERVAAIRAELMNVGVSVSGLATAERVGGADFAALRAEIIELLDAGLLDRKAIPRAVAEVWRL